nr:hypothetical protein [uncultured Cetobacterium sp.]
MKKYITTILLMVLAISFNAYSNPGKGKGKGYGQTMKKINQETNYGQNKDFDNWMYLNPYLRTKDSKELNKLYKNHLKEQKRLRKAFAKHSNEIVTLPAYRNYDDPMGYFINDFLYRPDRIKRYNFSNDFYRDMSKEEKIARDLLNLLSNF